MTIVMIDLKDIEEIDFCFYYDSKRHRYCISINYGEEYLDVTRKEGEAILKFLKALKSYLAGRRNFRSRSNIEEGFELQEVNHVHHS